MNSRIDDIWLTILQWIDGINHPEWGREEYQIASATTPPIVNYAKFKFSIEGAK